MTVLVRLVTLARSGRGLPGRMESATGESLTAPAAPFLDCLEFPLAAGAGPSITRLTVKVSLQAPGRVSNRSEPEACLIAVVAYGAPCPTAPPIG